MRPRHSPMKGECLSVLGLKETSTLEEATSRYRELCRHFHPDISRLQRNTANDAFIIVKKAWEHLKKNHSFPTTPAPERDKGGSANDSRPPQGTPTGSNNAREKKSDNKGSKNAPKSDRSTRNTDSASKQSHSSTGEGARPDRASHNEAAADERRARAVEDDAVQRILAMGILTSFCLVEDLRATILDVPPSPLKFPKQLFGDAGRREHQAIKSNIELVKKGYGASFLAKAAPMLVVKLERELASSLGVFDMTDPVDRYTYWTKLAGIAIERLEISKPRETVSSAAKTMKFFTEKETWSINYHGSSQQNAEISPQDFFISLKRAVPASALRDGNTIHISGAQVPIKIGTDRENTSAETLKRDSIRVCSANMTVGQKGSEADNSDGIEVSVYGKRINLRFGEDKIRTATISKVAGIYHITVQCHPSITEVTPTIYRYFYDPASPRIENGCFEIPGFVVLSQDPQRIGQSAGFIRARLK